MLFNSWSFSWRHRNGTFWHPRIDNYFYMGNASWTQGRVFASVDLATTFANEILTKYNDDV